MKKKKIVKPTKKETLKKTLKSLKKQAKKAKKDFDHSVDDIEKQMRNFDPMKDFKLGDFKIDTKVRI